jgi:hypothetical protein
MNSIVELAAHERFRRDANSARAKTNMKSAKQRRLRPDQSGRRLPSPSSTKLRSARIACKHAVAVPEHELRGAHAEKSEHVGRCVDGGDGEGLGKRKSAGKDATKLVAGR